MNFLVRDDILAINHDQTIRVGGIFIPPDNLRNSGQLDYIIDVVQTSIFGELRYKDIYEVAGAYCFFIIEDHIFFDGCKRTGFLSALNFLAINNYELNEDISNKEIVDLCIKVASDKIIHSEITDWFKNNTSHQP